MYESNARGLKTAAAQLLGQLITVTHIMFMLMERRSPTPGKVMDHRDGRRDNCKWSNLRESTQRQSNMNRRGWANEEGLERGVYRHRNRYRVSFTIHGQCKSFGYYVSKDDANALARSIRESIESIQGEYFAEASRAARPPEKEKAPVDFSAGAQWGSERRVEVAVSHCREGSPYQLIVTCSSLIAFGRSSRLRARAASLSSIGTGRPASRSTAITLSIASFASRSSWAASVICTSSPSV